MKRFLIAASCLSLVAPTIVEAQYNQEQNGKPEHQQQKPAGGPQGGGNYRPGGGGNYQPNYRPAPNNGGPPGGPNYRPGGAGGNNQPNYRPGGGGGNNPPNYRPGGGGGNNPPNYRPGPNYGGGQGGPNYRPGGNGGRPNYGPNYRGQRRYGVWNGQRYRGGGWVWPGGYSYRRWWIGGILPGIFLSQAYWFDDYADLGFGPPPYGCEWVRYGSDLLLVNIDTGQILDVEYGVFY